MTWVDLSKDMRNTYDWLDPESKSAELEWDGQVLRFKADLAIEQVMNIMATNRSLNTLWVRMKGKPLAPLMDFYRKSGYSVCGFGDIFGEYIEHGVKTV